MDPPPAEPAVWSGPRKPVGTTEDCPAPVWLAVVMNAALHRPRVRPREGLFLASDEARYVTGATFPVDAGFTLK
jgi:hypothetical protein